MIVWCEEPDDGPQRVHDGEVAEQVVIMKVRGERVGRAVQVERHPVPAIAKLFQREDLEGSEHPTVVVGPFLVQEPQT